MVASLYIFNFDKMAIKRLIFNIVLVALVVFILDFTIGKALRYFYFQETSGLHYRTTYSMDSTYADVLIFGSSHANHNYVPEVFEGSLKISFYNTGRDGNPVFYQTALLRSVLKRHTPKLIIFDFADSFEKEESDYDVLSSLLPYYETHEEIRDIIELKGPFETTKLISEIYPYNSQILTIAVGNLKLNKLRKPDNKGYVALHKKWQFGIDSIVTLYKYDVDSNKIDAFREFLTLAKNSGASVYVVFSPVFLKFNYRQEIEICQNICAEEGVPFWNYTKDTTFLNNNRLFQDVGHLNDRGARIFSKLIVNRIKQDTAWSKIINQPTGVPLE